MIQKCNSSDFDAVLAIINDAASAYKGVIPDDCWHEPYMSAENLRKDIDAKVVFYGYEDQGSAAAGNGKLIGVMGTQEFDDVTLIRHAYVLTSHRNKGIGGKLLEYIKTLSDKPFLVGTWRDTAWSIMFYQKHGFSVLDTKRIAHLLNKYWTVSDRHREMSVVLANRKWLDRAANT
ncbi:MAG: GNAT family N-acetyltransferase [Elusimicrobiota bacterium]